MKRMTAMLVCICILLSGCGAGRRTETGVVKPAENKTVQSDATVQSEGSASETDYLRYAVAAAALPELPQKPSDSEWDDFSKQHDYARMGAEAYQKAQDAFYDDYEARYRAYYDAVAELRGEGTDEADTAAFAQYTRDTAAVLLSGSENVIYSPANLYLALSMLSEVTDGESRTQVASLLGQRDGDAIRRASNSVWRQLYQDSAEGNTLLANSVWMAEGVQYNADSVKRLAENYYASCFSVPMGTESADKALRTWINDNTGGLLRDSANGLQTGEQTVLALISALCFRERWVTEFSRSKTETDTFTAADGREQRVEFMERTDRMGGFIRDRERGYTVAELAFQNGSAMRILLPDERVSLRSLLADGTAVGALLNYDMGLCIQRGEIEWEVPKFDLSSDLELTDALKTLGVADVFDNRRSDFTPLGSFDLGIFVSQVQHAARVKIDEEGCEAAAYTAIMADATAALPQDLPEIDMELDRPFAFLITGVKGLPLFLGTVNSVE